MALRRLFKCFKGGRKQAALPAESSETEPAGSRSQRIGVTLDEDHGGEISSSMARRILLSSSVDKEEQRDTSSQFLHTVTTPSIDAACSRFDEAVALIVFEASNRKEAAAPADGGWADELQAARVDSDAFNFQVRA